MYGKTAKSAHYLPRTGSYSTVPHRNGRVDILPPNASIQTFDDFKSQIDRTIQRIEALKKQRDDLVDAIKKKSAQYHEMFQRDKDKRYIAPAHHVERLKDKKRAVQHELNRLNATLSDLRRVTKERFHDPVKEKRAAIFANEFVNTARVMLPKDVFQKIFDHAASLVGESPRMDLPWHGQKERASDQPKAVRDE